MEVFMSKKHILVVTSIISLLSINYLFSSESDASSAVAAQASAQTIFMDLESKYRLNIAEDQVEAIIDLLSKSQARMASVKTVSFYTSDKSKSALSKSEEIAEKGLSDNVRNIPTELFVAVKAVVIPALGALIADRLLRSLGTSKKD
jgi:hypothetical protein